MNKQVVGKSKATDATGASVGKSVAVGEGAKATGKYIAWCSGPKEELREIYCVWKERLEYAMKIGNKALADTIEGIMAPMVELKWADGFDNNVTVEGKNYLLDKGFAGSTYTAAWYVGIFISAYSPTGSETYAAKGCTESSAYSQANRPTATWSAASAGSKALSSAAQFSINASVTIAGCFICTNNTKGDSTANVGVNALYSVGNFSGGDKVLGSGDTLNVSYTASLT